MDSEVAGLVEQFPERDDPDDPFSELTNEECTEPEKFYDRIIVGLADGDIVRGLEIMEKVTIVQALSWLLMRMSNEQ